MEETNRSFPNKRNNYQTPASDGNAAAAAFFNDAYAELKKNKVSLAAIEEQRDRVCFDYGRHANKHEIPTVNRPDGDGLPLPSVVTKHKRRRDVYGISDWVISGASLFLLLHLSRLYLSVEWWWQVLIAVAIFIVFWKGLPAGLETKFDVTQMEPKSILPIERILLLGLALAVFGIIGFSLMRVVKDTDGPMAFIYNNILTVSEIGFALAAATLHTLKWFYSWSIDMTAEYTKLTQEKNELEAVIAGLQARLGMISTSKETDKGEGEWKGNDYEH